MNKIRWIFLLIALDALLAVIFLPDWFVNPRERALGTWKERSLKLEATVSPEGITAWLPGGGKRRLTYQWVQDKASPYQCVLRLGEQAVPVEVEFDGKDVALVKPVINKVLADEERAFLRRFNRARHRPDDELVLRWVRVNKDGEEE